MLYKEAVMMTINTFLLKMAVYVSQKLHNKDWKLSLTILYSYLFLQIYIISISLKTISAFPLYRCPP